MKFCEIETVWAEKPLPRTDTIEDASSSIRGAKAAPAWVRATEILMRAAQRQTLVSPTPEDNEDNNDGEETDGE